MMNHLRRQLIKKGTVFGAIGCHLSKKMEVGIHFLLVLRVAEKK